MSVFVSESDGGRRASSAAAVAGDFMWCELSCGGTSLCPAPEAAGWCSRTGWRVHVAIGNLLWCCGRPMQMRPAVCQSKYGCSTNGTKPNNRVLMC